MSAQSVPSMEPVEQAETVMAHRVWRWTANDGLAGPSGVSWKTSRMRAVCASHSHPAPNGWAPNKMPWPCWCGVNAFKLTEFFDLNELQHAVGKNEPGFTDCLPVVGVVELGGIVDEYERGYRAEYGQIQELTVLTSLPVDLTGLREQYDVPVRAMSYEDWRKEWEITYGQDRERGDRESGETDQNPQTGTPAFPPPPFPAFTGSTITGTFTYSGTSTNGPLWTNAQLNRLMTAVRTTPEPSRWHKIKWWWREDGGFLIPLGLAVLFLVFLLSTLATDALGWTTWWESAGYKLEQSYNLTWGFS